MKLWAGSATAEAVPGAPFLIQVKAAVADPRKCQVWQLCCIDMCDNLSQSYKQPNLHLSGTCQEGACCMLDQRRKLESGLGLPSM